MTLSSKTPTTTNPLPGLFVDTQWLQNHLETPGLRILQVGGEKYYPQHHIPGAVFLPYPQLITLRDGVPGIRADTSSLVQLFGQLGIQIDTPVVAYDLSGGMDAARTLWTLTTLGHQKGAMLDGGFGAWFKEGRPMDFQVPKITPVTFSPNPTLEWEVDESQVIMASQNKLPMLIVDTRSPREYQGLTMRLPRGHIAGAVHLNWTDSVIHNNDPRIKDPDTLKTLFAQIGLTDPEQEVIVYCETGHRASQTWLLLRHMGFKRVRLYDGSMAEWRAQNLPVVAGENPNV